MAIWDRFMGKGDGRALTGANAVARSNAVTGMADSWLRNILIRSAPRYYSPRAVMQLPAVAASVRLVQAQLASLPMVVEERRGDDWEPVQPDDPEALIVSGRWGAFESSNKARRMVARSVMLWGFAAIRVDRDGARLAGLTVLNPDEVQRNEENGEVVYRYTPSVGGQVQLDRTDLAWFDYYDPANDRVSIVAPLELSWHAIRLGLAAIYFGSGYFERGATGELFFVQGMDDETASAVTTKEVWAEEDEMRREGRRSLLLPPGVDVKQLSSNIADAKLAEIVLTATKAAAACFSIPNILVGDDSQSTLAHAAQQELRFARNVLTDFASTLAEELSVTIWPGLARRVRFDFSDVTSEDRATRYQAYSLALNRKPWLEANEVREMEGFEPLDGGAGLDAAGNPLQDMVDEAVAASTPSDPDDDEDE